MTCKIGIVGGGPSGVFCALQILMNTNSSDVEVTIFEKKSLLHSILPTGGGRCNLSYDERDFKELAKNYPRGEKFLYSIFSRFDVTKTLDMFENLGIKTYIQEDLRIFPVSNSSKALRDKLISELLKHKNLDVRNVDVNSSKMLDKFDKIIIATGARGGYELAKAFCHTITPIAPSLLGYITKEKYPKGVSIDINGEPILFTHQGVSGPFVYKHSSINAFCPYPRQISLQLLDFDVLKERIKENPKKSFGNILSEFLPRSFVKCITKDFDKNSCEISDNQIKKTLRFELNVLAPDNKGEIVTAGGVSLLELDKNCKSKINDKLYFIGEIMDIDGFCGGFNLQNCWSTASVAAFDIINSL